MFGIFLSVIYTALGWLVKSVLVKFVVFFGLFFITTEFIAVITTLMPNSSSLNGALAGITAGMAYFLDSFALPTGLSLVVAAYATRFLILRIPVIG